MSEVTAQHLYFGHTEWLDDNADADPDCIPTRRLEETSWTSSDHMDEDSPNKTRVPQSHIDWSSQCGLESPALEVQGCEWHYALLIVQARNDDDDA